VAIDSITESNLLDVRQAIDRAKGFHAFGGASLDTYTNDPLRSELLWHFDFWRLRQLRENRSLTPLKVLAPGVYEDVVVVLADLCSFSSYVRDTPEADLIRHCLTSFYSKTRYQIIKRGGMLYQFMGDAVVGLFGVPDQQEGYVENAIHTAKALLSIGASVSHHWQRHIDHAQPASGLRVGMAIGDLQMVSLRPFGRIHMGAISDAINIAARLQKVAEPHEIVVSNSLHNQLSAELQATFDEMGPVEAHNLGQIKAWKYRAAEHG
jgi:class 3 adenylate cyclase